MLQDCESLSIFTVFCAVLNSHLFRLASAVSAYYNLIIEDLTVGDEALALPPFTFQQGYGAVLDSGTTFAYLPRPVFQPFVDAVRILFLYLIFQASVS